MNCALNGKVSGTIVQKDGSFCVKELDWVCHVFGHILGEAYHLLMCAHDACVGAMPTHLLDLQILVNN